MIPSAARVKKFRKLLKKRRIIRILEAHNGLTGLIVEKTNIKRHGKQIEFDGIWESSLTDSTSKGKPDTSIVDTTSRLLSIQEILEVTTKPIVFDADNGGLIEHFPFTVRSLERMGISAVVIEDKIGFKKNSLFDVNNQNQDSVENFCEKIKAGKKSQITKDFMVIARIESLIFNKGIDDALRRAKAYLQAGTDGILIHSKMRSPEEILTFANSYQSFAKGRPLVVVPTTYNTITEDQLEEAGIKVVIYANHLIRSAYPAMVNVAELILKHQRSSEADKLCLPIQEVLNLIPS
ncbi:phosphoenolpyruvate mutase [Candidatus Roizmanbacteria bacterium RIFCSPLOWO2_01_FULL_38_12]|uniref:phosphoenolpyruvate mutase n=1 Tax=Candidatus Roizmanbacteria bacterium RIFCSPLOWO2_01_FULL_38_12 TaxID=1802061 RepID=A0A1F7ISS1_9BACT|nr:MAG: phosphoenolpyruvate mutase [Candidatus Roizmanbacteria bacterium RIFCSPHIGHO2_01_FULL_38_15]OGK35802.1 MAG: phosphoenolpyruvate mutase [Candidatus Roizmanbacteria bacterium RIFCSPHIGHO2_12_FULL_38_13]OGK46375.1 MAG: phosphoenolpyruvate mutase [Candidatus Roizmanbacteria bacterium RIFCSPLOWO2_01_FULL_38_12]